MRWARGKEANILAGRAIGDGLEMMVAFLRERWDGTEGREVVEAVLQLVDVGARGRIIRVCGGRGEKIQFGSCR
jgi:hypothetical protein